MLFPAMFCHRTDRMRQPRRSTPSGAADRGPEWRPQIQLCWATMIHPYDNQTQNRWNRGEFKVQLSMRGNGRPLGYCEGTEEDVAALQAIAEAEGAEQVRIHKQVLKSGREIWTVG